MGTKRIKQSPGYGFPESGLAHCEMLSWVNLKYVYIRTLHIHVLVEPPVKSRAEHTHIPHVGQRSTLVRKRKE